LHLHTERASCLYYISINLLHAQPLQTGVAALADVFGTTAHPEIFSLGIADIAKLGSENHLRPPAFDGLADQFFILAAAIHVGRVEEVESQIQRPVNGGKHDCVNLFVSEGACVSDIVAQIEARGEEVPRDAFGHVRLDKVNVGAWFAKQFAEMIGAEKTLVQKSGYYSRAAAANAADRKLIKRCAIKAVQCAFAGQGGVVGEDAERGDKLRAIEFERMKGGKPFNIKTKWFVQLLKEIGQPIGKAVEVKH